MESESILLNENDEPLGLDPLSKLHRSSKILRTVDSLLLYEPESPFHLNGQPFPPFRSPTL